jgi:hypothetical protein
MHSLFTMTKIAREQSRDEAHGRTNGAEPMVPRKRSPP